ncbi:hypothetical protein CMQ_7454 [Grosmannia clavigera kw1407]|uniref:Uncharacterized protein n=1 Tax=Grosmannia clavigera (strain kw1407 / UAMH 11150) TaxID=655863 RepID=F0XP35_GROCL|nr:uncharacterized protein CMQ_7454 [Grosmannia clavigera kw1407]EFX00452.1 hypothetical protein CMQ_7454 [Grosmannia clavigera kw1407]
MPTSLESARPIMAPSARTSVRYSTYSVAPSCAPTFQTTDSATAEIHTIEQNLVRMENKALQQQRVSLNEEKTAVFQKLALGAKLDRALERRMTSQDAVMRPPRAKKTDSTILDEKSEKL